MTECIQPSFTFADLGHREVVARFDGGHVTSDGGALLLRQVEQKTRILERLAQCFTDRRDPSRTDHSVAQLVRQRVYGLALGYEDLTDHDQLRHDPLLGLLAGKHDPGSDKPAGKSTLNRLELTHPLANAAQHRYKKILFDPESADQLLVQLFVEAHRKPPDEIVLDLDATDDPLHGKQEGRFFHGYYRAYCYLPLYVFCGDHLLACRLRSSNQEASAGAVDEIERIVGQIRLSWPKVKVVLRADSGFCRDELMSWCEEHRVDYVFGLARNRRLEQMVEEGLAQAQAEHERTREPARVFRELRYQTRESWSRERRVVAKCEHLDKGPNPRFVVTSLSEEQWPARRLYEERYCARGEMENRIKEQLQLFADRTSTHWRWSNQLRLYFSAFAYVLIDALRRLGLKGTVLAEAEAATIRLRLLKIGALVRISVRRIAVALSSGSPVQGAFQQAYEQLRC